MIFRSVRLATTDINGPNARKYSERDSIYVSPSGKDGYLGHVANLPAKTLTQVSNLLKKINVNSTTIHSTSGTYYDSFVIDSNASINRPITFLGNGCNITKDLVTYYPSLSTPNYLKYEIPISGDYMNIPYDSIYVNGEHMKPMSFPRKGAIYGNYTTLPGNRFWVNDSSGFLDLVYPLINSYFNVSNRGRLLFGTPFYFGTPAYFNLSSIHLSGGNKYIIASTGHGSYTAFSVIPFTSDPRINFSSIINQLNFYDGDYILSKEEYGKVSIYCKPTITNEDNKLIIYTNAGDSNPTNSCISIRDNRNVSIFDVNTDYGYYSLQTRNTSSICITGCKFKNSKYSSVYFYNTLDTTFKDNLIVASGWNGVDARILSAMVIDNNIFRGIGMNGTGEGYSNSIYTGLDANPDYSKKLTDLYVRNNDFKYSAGGNLDINFVNGLVLSGNKIENTGYGFSEDMGGLRTGACRNVNISNNLIRNVRQHPASRNGMGLYIDGQCASVRAYKNIVDNAGTPFLSNEPGGVILNNNIFMGGNGPNAPMQLQFTTSSDNMGFLGWSPSSTALSAVNNIHIASQTIVSKYLREYDKTFGRPLYRFFSLDSIHPAMRVTHKFFSSNPNDHKTFWTNPGYGSGNNHFYMRIGQNENRPIYSTSTNQRLMVKDGNWIQILWNYWTPPIASLSTNCGIENYYYPWQVPSNAWFNSITKVPVNFTFIDGVGEWKRSVPWYTQNYNCFYTDLSESSKSLTLSTDSYAFRGASQRDINMNHINPSYENVGYTETLSSANTEIIPLSSSFEEVLPNWNTESIFTNPEINRDNYLVQNNYVKNYLNFQDIDISAMGSKNNPFEYKIDQDKFNPTYGSLDWSDNVYGNHNDIPYIQTILPNIAGLRAYTYYFDSPVTVLGVGDFAWDNSSSMSDNGTTIIIPNGWGGKLGRWILD